MPTSLKNQLNQLKKAYESGAIDKFTYDNAVAGIQTKYKSEQLTSLDERSVMIQGDSNDSTIITGDTQVNQFLGNIYHGPEPDDPEKILDKYCEILVHSYRHLPLRGVDIKDSDPENIDHRLSLTRVYIDLDTKTLIDLPKQKKDNEHKQRPLSAKEAAIKNSKMVLLGDPGSGKTTFVNYLILQLISNNSKLNNNNETDDKLEFPTSLLPVPIILRDFAASLSNDIKKAEPQHLWDFFVNWLNTKNLGFAKNVIHDKIENGQAILLLDGLDEIPTKNLRGKVKDAIHVFIDRYPDIHMIVTCRVLSYQNRAWQLNDFPTFELASFSESKIDKFILAWYADLARLGSIKNEKADGLAKKLQTAVRGKDLWRLAPNPLLLTVMALVHTHKGRLPDARALLYEDALEILLWRWEQIKLGDNDHTPALRELLLEANRTDMDLKRVLWKLAFDAHSKGNFSNEDALADIGEFQLQKALSVIHPEESLDWAKNIINKIRMRAGLLIERSPEVYTFPHRTFQEYMAGSHLTTLKNFAKQASKILKEGALFREVVLLAVGRLVYLTGDQEKALMLANELCPSNFQQSDKAYQKVWMAGDVLLEIGLNRVNDTETGKDLYKRVQKRLVELIQKEGLSPVERAKAGNTLSRLGDPRFNKDMFYLPNEPLLGFIEIPEGNFIMGSDPKKDKNAYENEFPEHTVHLPTFYMARYPVTVAQYRLFMEMTGQKPDNFWEKYNRLDNHPVRAVTWYESMEYCKWLDKTIRKHKKLPVLLNKLLNNDDWHIRLPTEAEWEKSARGTDGRIFPWGNNVGKNKANGKEIGIGTICTVGCFASGRSPFQCDDMAGNVWELTHSNYGKNYRLEFPYPYQLNDGRQEVLDDRSMCKVVRWGAFHNNISAFRCGRRIGDFPDDRNRNRDNGFRVVFAPGYL